MAQYQPQQPIGGGMILNGDNGAVVAGEHLKEVDTPVETLLGAANGAVSGLIVSSAISAAVTIGKEGRGNVLQKTFQNITNGHLIGVLAGTAAFAAMGGLVRFSRAKKHNEWSEKHYGYLENRRNPSFADQVQHDKAEIAKEGHERG